MAVTIADVAAEAGVSKATVSRTFGMPDRVNTVTRTHVLAVAEQLGYVPDPAPRSTRTGSVGLIVPDIVNPFFPPMIKAVQRRARSRNYGIYLADSDAHAGEEAEAVAEMSKQVDGLIFWSSRLPSETLVDIAGRVPTVLVNRSAGGLPTVVASSEDGMRQAVEHLYALGHTRCAYVNAPRGVWSNQHRRAAVRRTCKALGMELVELGPFAQSVEGGVQAADIVAAHGVTAAIANNDLTAIGLMLQLANRGLSVPDDISVVGVDDTFVASLMRPQLTTVRIPVDEIGSLAVDLLLNLLQSGDKADTGPVEVDTQLIVRESTGPVTAEIHWPSRPLPSQD
ncbi:LacI family DNA-binding transcriptional regulator [Kribbella solani]|uniref:LacI family DNA-binding transcriptional regulator n=1 Tax=Kribbella solani TaxID=236067 RepID=UPI0029B77845|nr:LacI family DNA-binding transcriptional regulator [Kribbella solani]MDX2971292.1 LacI family DNA-binding transcriptional regulator [Kribbella solani]MDX3005555.1 LacI family DNA-binding transcriptional regulator [Kribbella solani]